MPAKYISKKYIVYGFSIIFSKGFELLVLFFAAGFLTKKEYGGLEYYKKVIEVGASFIALGFPTLIMSYTRSEQSKKYFYYLSIIFVLFFSLLLLPFLVYFHYDNLLLPFVFFSIFFTGGITQSYLLVSKGSNITSLYKIVVSVIFYVILFVIIYVFHKSIYAFLYPSYIIFPLMFVWVLFDFIKSVNFHILKRYSKLFYKLLLSSFTLVISNFSNLMFLYTDIFIIKYLSSIPEIEIANYSFALNIANMLIIIPLTLVQVDIEKLKHIKNYIFILNKKIFVLLVLASIFLLIAYKFIINYGSYRNYADTYILFILLLAGKIFQSLAVVYGANLIINKAFFKNLVINIFMLIVNILLSYYLYKQSGVIGVAIASILSLLMRWILLIIENRKYIKQ